MILRVALHRYVPRPDNGYAYFPPRHDDDSGHATCDWWTPSDEPSPMVGDWIDDGIEGMPAGYGPVQLTARKWSGGRMRLEGQAMQQAPRALEGRK